MAAVRQWWGLLHGNSDGEIANDFNDRNYIITLHGNKDGEIANDFNDRNYIILHGNNEWFPMCIQPW